MSQHDLDIANANGATVRGDINSALQAQGSNQKGSSAPSTGYAGQFWLDDSATPWVLNVNDGAAQVGALLINATSNTVRFIGGLSDTNENEALDVVATASAVNHVKVTNAATGSGPSIEAAGDDTNVAIEIGSQGAADLTLSTDGTTRVTLDHSASNVSFSWDIEGATDFTVGNNEGEEIDFNGTADEIRFNIGGSQEAYIDSSGLRVDGDVSTANRTTGLDSQSTLEGQFLDANGELSAANSDFSVATFNRLGSDGAIIRLQQAGTTEGTISVSGTTVSYNSFTGSHWGRLMDNSRPDIPIGTVMEARPEALDWYQARYTEKGVNKRVSIPLPSGKTSGDRFDFDDGAKTRRAQLIKEEDLKHVYAKVSDTAESAAVYGVFTGWEDDGASGVNDFLVAAIGTHPIRIGKGVTVATGDLLVSAGDGTARVQADDIVRSKTLGKVISPEVRKTYKDGSFLVACALMAG